MGECSIICLQLSTQRWQRWQAVRGLAGREDAVQRCWKAEGGWPRERVFHGLSGVHGDAVWGCRQQAALGCAWAAAEDWAEATRGPNTYSTCNTIL